jgi:hypothetical protein
LEETNSLAGLDERQLFSEPVIDSQTAGFNSLRNIVENALCLKPIVINLPVHRTALAIHEDRPYIVVDVRVADARVDSNPRITKLGDANDGW